MNVAEKLLGLECPVNWNLETALAAMKSRPSSSLEQEANAVKKATLEKIQCDVEYARIDGSAALQKCSQYLTMAWLQYADSSLCLMEKYLEEAVQFVVDVHKVSKIELITLYTNALKYLFNAMIAHFHDKRKNFRKVREYLDLLPPFDDLENHEQAAIFAVKSCVFMEFGPAGHIEALRAINRALELENQPEWHFLKGKCLSRYRRAHNHMSVPSDEELLHLRKAVEVEQGSASHYVFCGQSVREYASYSPAARNDASVQDAHMNECEELLGRAFLLNGDSPIILTRIAKGLMHLKGNRGVDLLEHCVHRSLELYPESKLANHVAGNFYMYKKRNPKQAIFHLKKAADHGILGAFVNYIDIVWKTSTDIDIDPLLQKFWSTFRNDPVNRFKAASLMASYYFFVKDDILKSITFWREVMDSRETIDMSRNTFCEVSDLTVLLVGEALNRLNRSNLSSDEKGILRSFRSEVIKRRPGLDWSTIHFTREEHIKKALLKMPEDVKQIVTPKLQGKFSSTRNYSIPARRTDRRDRQLPQNWRQP